MVHHSVPQPHAVSYALDRATPHLDMLEVGGWVSDGVPVCGVAVAAHHDVVPCTQTRASVLQGLGFNRHDVVPCTATPAQRRLAGHRDAARPSNQGIGAPNPTVSLQG